VDMSDPQRHKRKTEIFMDAVSNVPVEANHRFYLLEDKENVAGMKAAGTLEETLLAGLKDVSPSPVTGIYNTHISFSYVEEDVLKDFDYANTLVVASLPYCLHLPNEYEYEVSIPEESLKAMLTFRKIWTNKATEDGKPTSSSADFYAEDKTLYFKSGVILTPRFPIREEEGWQQNFTGKNIEGIKEQNGVFRYTRLYIQLDTNFTSKDLDTDNKGELIESVKEKALMVVNRVLDSYRFVTKLEHIQRMGTLETSMIYFMSHKKGFHTSSSGFGIETAPMNRSRKEIVEIGRMLKEDIRPDLYELLLLDAQISFDNKDFALAVMQSFQALEIYLERILFEALKKRGDSDPDIESYLGKYWRTKERLKDALKELRGKSLSELDKALWERWCTIYDKTRNEIIHKGKEPKMAEVASCLEANRQIIEYLRV
jgi:HEPN domain-containing protein